MSFLPEDYVERRIEQRTNMICVSLFVVVLAAMVGGYVVTAKNRAAVRHQADRVNKQYAEAARRMEQLEELEKRKGEVVRKAQVTAALVEPVPRSRLLADLVNRMPAAMSLLEIQLATKEQKHFTVRRVVDHSKSALANKDKSQAPEEPPAPKVTVTVSLVGVAPTDVQVAQYMAGLSQSPLLGDVNLVFSEEAKLGDATMRKFRIDMTIRPDADVRQIKPLLVPRSLRGNAMKLTRTATPPPSAPGIQTVSDHPGEE
jgi:Tfp pilus assembly protein PilN